MSMILSQIPRLSACAIEACISNIFSLQGQFCGGLFIGQLTHTSLSASGCFYLRLLTLTKHIIVPIKDTHMALSHNTDGYGFGRV